MNESDSISYFFDSLRPCIESQRLARFVDLHPGERMLDVGCGTGYIALFLGWRFPHCLELTGIDIQSSLIERACQNRDRFLTLASNPIPPIHFYQSDLNRAVPKEKIFDVIVSNPPFFDPRSSRLSPTLSKRIARQENTLSLQSLFAFASRHLALRGRFYLVVPSNRIDEIQSHLVDHQMDPLQIETDLAIRKRTGGVHFICASKREPS